MWSNESGKAEEQRLHEDRCGQLDMHMFDVVHKGRNEDASDELTRSSSHVSLEAYSVEVAHLPRRDRIYTNFDWISGMQVEYGLRIQSGGGEEHHTSHEDEHKE